MGTIILGLAFVVLGLIGLITYLRWYHRPSKHFEISFLFNSITFKIKGGRMSTEISTKQKFEFDVAFKNKKENPARVDGALELKFVDPNTDQPLTTTATATATAVDPDENGNSSKHHVVVTTSDEEIAAVTTASLQATADVDLDNDKDDSTSDDVKSVTFDLLTVVFKPLVASQVAIENLSPVEDLP